MLFGNSKILVTGAAGFIGAALIKKLLSKENEIVGIDNLNDYYNRKLKLDRLKTIEEANLNLKSKWHFERVSLEQTQELRDIFLKYKPQIVINLAAQAGVRYSIKNPQSYISSNLLGFGNILDCCKEFKIQNLIYASSSSVYGGNTKTPFDENDSVNHPVSLYAATKKANELMAHSYSHLYGIPSTGLRFFTVYGPWGRPDMAPMIFANSIFQRKEIDIYNFGNMKRDFTYIDDIIDGICGCCNKPATSNTNFDFLNPEPSSSFAPYKIFNIGLGSQVDLMKFIEILENEIGIKAIKNFKEMQPGDVKATNAKTENLKKWIDFKATTSLELGIKSFVKWYKNYYGY